MSYKGLTTATEIRSVCDYLFRLLISFTSLPEYTHTIYVEHCFCLFVFQAGEHGARSGAAAEEAR